MEPPSVPDEREAQLIPPLLSLPAELIHQILSLLPPTALALASQTCRTLYNASISDTLWQSHIAATLPRTPPSSYPCPTYRALYASHHPYWFLPKHQIWFGDGGAGGKLLIARYDHRRGCIEAYALGARRSHVTHQIWADESTVPPMEAIVSSFEPEVQLDMNKAEVKLDLWKEGIGEGENRLQKEIFMSMDGHGIYSLFMLARDLPPELISKGTAIWPPLVLPAQGRTRNESVQQFSGKGHKPSRLSEASEYTFRVRQWVEFSGSLSHSMGIRVADEVSTFATLPRECWTPTKEKPWRGIWVGDYNAHGCEFLVVLQPDEEEVHERPLPEMSGRLAGGLMDDRVAASEQDQPLRTANGAGLSDDEFDQADDSANTASAGAGAGAESFSVKESPSQNTSSCPHHGRIEAIKLTGDINVPRGEYTFFAPDISDAGLVRIAQEELFKGARVVRSMGHIAERGFGEDTYISTQLYLIDEDTIAQFWECWRHFSYYRRVDVARFLHVDDGSG